MWYAFALVALVLAGTCVLLVRYVQQSKSFREQLRESAAAELGQARQLVAAYQQRVSALDTLAGDYMNSLPPSAGSALLRLRSMLGSQVRAVEQMEQAMASGDARRFEEVIERARKVLPAEQHGSGQPAAAHWTGAIEGELEQLAEMIAQASQRRAAGGVPSGRRRKPTMTILRELGLIAAG